MPNNKIHRIFTRRKYGVDGGDIHRWMDEPSQYLGPAHRILRHEYSLWIPNVFIEKFGLSLAQAIVRSHIWLDENWHWLKDSKRLVFYID